MPSGARGGAGFRGSNLLPRMARRRRFFGRRRGEEDQPGEPGDAADPADEGDEPASEEFDAEGFFDQESAPDRRNVIHDDPSATEDWEVPVPAADAEERR